MNDDYLWDKSGEPDPEIQRMENLLTPLGHRPGPAPVWTARPSKRAYAVLLAVAASVLVIVGAVWMIRQRNRPAWLVASVEGAPTRTRLGNGQSFSTDAHSRARLDMDEIGEVQVEPNTKLSVVAMKAHEQRLALDHGTIHALIWAPPGLFFVNTPSSQTVDLGCEYTLHVDADGVGLVQVTVGWVGFENNGRESFIPAEAACVTRPGKGPGIPYYEDASPVVIEGVHRFDMNADRSAIDVILSGARGRDGITLWHLLRRVPAEDRGRVYDRLAGFIKVPSGVSRDAVVAGDSKMTDLLWDAMDLGDTSWWRMWKSRTVK